MSTCVTARTPGPPRRCLFRSQDFLDRSYSLGRFRNPQQRPCKVGAETSNAAAGLLPARINGSATFETLNLSFGAGAASMRGEQRKGVRVRLEHRRPVNLVGVDGTWRRACPLLDVS